MPGRHRRIQRPRSHTKNDPDLFSSLVHPGTWGSSSELSIEGMKGDGNHQFRQSTFGSQRNTQSSISCLRENKMIKKKEKSIQLSPRPLQMAAGALHQG
ncbi:hypothetical protein BDQ94DRAFT_27975 [Aspergillus welwitschiae]|uniref:Uncharacterized protein n=1 Tax=Aspergillus welwitschiae TaxID=1341132 RepID=A0A3F3Q448_9EURO|nr:hypothetical protein BDQ94DRAFT_27975 [Aspergillus welwitschiae]RDH33953.1 hypothetical protein BDQ94DRAFT_27975 [Aspergillus welwitschiae]